MGHFSFKLKFYICGLNFKKMNFDFKEFISATMILFAIIDIVGNIPLIVLFREKFKVIESEKASIISLLIMIVFLYIGEALLNLLGVDINSFAVAGSIIILFLATEMILGIKLYKDNNPKTASVVPIAFPLIAGPGTLTTLISIKSEYNEINIILAIIFNMILVYFILKSSEKLQKILGVQGINILRKVFGIILLAIGIKLFTSNIKLIFA
tara:strand:- start:648 stop:1280 length:633 start_codon:yes stop_codon:yes gene_type:complete